MTGTDDFDDGDQDGDNGYEEAMKRLAVLKSMPVESLTDAERKEKLRLANRESARKMRRKQAVQLAEAEVQVQKLDAETQEYMNKLAEGWHRYKEIKTENEVLRGELHALQSLQATMAPPGEGAEAGAPPTSDAQGQPAASSAPGPDGSAPQPGMALNPLDLPPLQPIADGDRGGGAGVSAS